MPAHFPHLVDPETYPDYTRRPVRVPTWRTFDHATQFTTLRGFRIENDLLVDWQEELDLHTKAFPLGRVVWPNFTTVFPRNFPDLVKEIRKRRLYLFDIWGHVPGSSYEGPWNHVMPPKGMVSFLERALGERFLGFDNGEQDGRYVGGYARQQCPSPHDRFRQYINFQRHFERMCDDLGNHMSALVSLCFGHYFLKEGNHVLLGAETAQALPCSQVYYAFIRGACKQYGILWFGNASVFNRWGFKSYAGEGTAEGYSHGPRKGTSLNLLKRLLYTHYLYNSVAIGFEMGWFDAERRLSPIGRIQAAASQFVETHGQPGPMHAPVALLLDHVAGWAMPRHLYTSAIYQVWGGMPYDAGDYLTHGTLSLLYPGYEDASYFRDERGFLTPTPYGDMTDCLLSDVPPWVLAQYGLVLAAGDLSVDEELRQKLDGFLEEGGHLVVTAANAQRLWPSLQVGEARRFPADTRVDWLDGTSTEEGTPFDLCPLGSPAEGTTVLARCGGVPAAVRFPRGAGSVSLLLSPFGLNAEPRVSGLVENVPEKPLACPYSLLHHVRRVLGDALAEQRIFSVGDGLGWVTCRRGPGDYVLGIHNNGMSPRPLQIASLVGPIEHIQEIPLDASEKGAVGYWPEGLEGNDPGVSDGATIAGGDIRIFAIRIRETGVRVLESVSPPPEPRNRCLALRGIHDLKEAILRYPTFFQHFDGAKVDWTYLRDRDRKQVQRERDWLRRQGLRLIVDFSPGLNFYPGLTLLDTLAFRYEESLAALDDAFRKMDALGARDAVFCLHRKPENHCDNRRADDRFLAGVRDLCHRAARRGLTLFLHHHPQKWHGTAKRTLQFIEEVGATEPASLQFALHTAHAAMTNEPIREVQELAGDRLGLVLLAAPRRDIFGQSYDAHAPLYPSSIDLRPVKPLTCPIVLDADYANWDEVYRDRRLLDGTIGRTM